jgi:hypothetical protein
MKSNKIITTLIAVSVLLIFGFGCQAITSKFGGGASADPKTAVQNSYQKFMDAKFYHSTIKTKMAQGETETELDYNAPDKFWMKNKMANMKNEGIYIGDDSYTRFNEGKWTKMPAGPNSISELRNKMSKDAVEAMKDIEAVGPESVNGKDATVYKFKSNYMGESTSKMWVSTESGLPLKVESEGSYNGTTLQMTITYDYDKEVKIEAPTIN